MDVCPVEGTKVGLGVDKSKAGVAIDSVSAGESPPEGVEACSVANRSGVEGEAMGLLQPITKRKSEMVKRTFRLFIIRFN